MWLESRLRALILSVTWWATCGRPRTLVREVGRGLGGHKLLLEFVLDFETVGLFLVFQRECSIGTIVKFRAVYGIKKILP